MVSSWKTTKALLILWSLTYDGLTTVVDYSQDHRLLNSAETCLASFFRVAEFHVLSERLVNWTLFSSSHILRSHRSSNLNVSHSFVPFSSASSLSTTVPLSYSITSLFRASFCRPGDRHCSSAAAPPLSRPPEANDLAQRSALSSPSLPPPLSFRLVPIRKQRHGLKRRTNVSAAHLLANAHSSLNLVRAVPADAPRAN